jgi:hypothetical protein
MRVTPEIEITEPYETEDFDQGCTGLHPGAIIGLRSDRRRRERHGKNSSLQVHRQPVFAQVSSTALPLLPEHGRAQTPAISLPLSSHSGRLRTLQILLAAALDDSARGDTYKSGKSGRT